MKRISTEDVVRALTAAGLGKGDSVLVHSDLIRFGLPQNGVATYLDAFAHVLGPTGTLCAPTFSFSFIGSGYYDWSETPSQQMGAFAEAVRKHPDAKRTRHPLQSIAAIGPLATQLAAIETASAYAPDGVFQAMSDLGVKVVLLGADPIHISHSHLSEEACRVPYRFDKTVSGKTRLGPTDAWTEQDWTFFARDLELDIRPEGEDRIVNALVTANEWTHADLNGVPIYAGSAKSFVDALTEKLR